MRAGKLRHRLVIQELVTGSPVVNSYGEPHTEWAEFITVSGSLEPLEGRELWSAQSVNPETVYQSQMRYHEGIDKAMRIVFEGKYYNITAIKDIEMRHKQLVLELSEGLNLG